MHISSTTKYQYAHVPHWALNDLPESPSGSKHHPGFVLIEDCLVSTLFLEKISDELEGGNYRYGSVTRVQDLFDEPAFWDSLSEMERRMVGPCLLFLIDNGNLGNT